MTSLASPISFETNGFKVHIVRSADVAAEVTPAIPVDKPALKATPEPEKLAKKRKAFVWTEARKKAFEACTQKRKENLEKRRAEKQAEKDAQVQPKPIGFNSELDVPTSETQPQ
jgi:hypothetical protein